jgi:hypothetical protein
MFLLEAHLQCSSDRSHRYFKGPAVIDDHPCRS